jgi:hypothetical protein
LWYQLSPKKYNILADSIITTMFEKLFGWGKKQAAEAPVLPAINFGRYSDNNKSPQKIAQWTNADNLFKEKKYAESLDAFFDYLKDDAVANVSTTRNDGVLKFELSQGSKIVRGTCDATHLQAEVTLARMPQPSVAVMRRLLEQNFALYYSRYALDNGRLCMRFDSDVETANPNKLYYALKELATKADKQDDLLVKDFATLEPLDTDHLQEIPDAEKEVKYQFWQKWIKETLDYTASLDAEKISGGIAYLLLALVYRLDYLISPEGALLSELEKIPAAYFAKDEKPATEKNALMTEAFKKLLEKPKAEVTGSLFRSKSTFALMQPQQHKAIVDSVYGSNQNMIWYRDNSYPLIAACICEYGLSFCQYSYSLPRPLTELFQLLMQVNYPDYFEALGFGKPYYNPVQNKFSNDAIIERINRITSAWRNKYPMLEMKTANLQFDNLVSFNHSFTAEIEFLNFENK